MKNKFTYSFDILIIGGGPAGCAVALTLKKYAPHLKVGLLEDHSRKKRWLESLSPAAGELLRSLGIWEAFINEKYQAAFGTTASWGADQLHENEFIFHGRGNGWHIQRESFDLFLRNQCRSRHVQVLEGFTYKSHKREDGKWRLNAFNGQNKQVLATNYVMDASGRGSVFAKKEGAKKRPTDRLLGVYRQFNLGQAVARGGYTTLVEAAENGWWYSAPLHKNACLMGWMTDSDLFRQDKIAKLENFMLRLKESKHSFNRIKNFDHISEAELFPASSYQLNKFGGKNWIATGDAASTVDPLSSSGTVRALRNGMLAAYVAMDHFSNKDTLERYNSLIQKEFNSFLNSRRMYYEKEKRWANTPFWLRRKGLSNKASTANTQKKIVTP